MNFPLQSRVKNTKTAALGTVCPDLMSCCADTEVPVVYDGETSFLGTEERDLELLGAENAKADLVKCGAGKGAECCIFLTVGPYGPDCERFSSLRFNLIFKDGMTAKRHPEQPFPACQIFDDC